jgi:hypothetical protein
LDKVEKSLLSAVAGRYMGLRILEILNDMSETLEPEVTAFEMGTAVTC